MEKLFALLAVHLSTNEQKNRDAEAESGGAQYGGGGKRRETIRDAGHPRKHLPTPPAPTTTNLYSVILLIETFRRFLCMCVRRRFCNFRFLRSFRLFAFFFCFLFFVFDFNPFLLIPFCFSS